MEKKRFDKFWLTFMVIALGIIVAITGLKYNFLNLFNLPLESFIKILEKDTEKNPPVEEKKPIFYSPLTGEEVASDLSFITPVAIVIDNNVSARPPSGLSWADIIYEVPIEGGITRFFAIFQSKLPEKIGPVRSLRMAFLDIVNEYSAVLIHCGGDSRALKKINSGAVKVKDLDEIKLGGYFWRDRNRISPYNLFTSSSNLEKAKKDRGWENLSEPLKFFSFTKPSEEKGAIFKVEVKSFSYTYSVKWIFNPEKNLYERNQGGAQHTTNPENDVLTTHNLLVLITRGVIATNLGHLDLDIVGEGKAYLFKNGNSLEVSWIKKSPSARLEIYDLEGKEITLSPGRTWITIITDSKKLFF